MERGGYIRFVGGPEHNRFIRLREWRPWYQCYDRTTLPPLSWDTAELTRSLSDSITMLTYRLQPVCTDRGTKFYEYWLEGEPEHHPPDFIEWPNVAKRGSFELPHFNEFLLALMSKTGRYDMATLL